MLLGEMLCSLQLRSIITVDWADMGHIHSDILKFDLPFINGIDPYVALPQEAIRIRVVSNALDHLG